MKTKQGLSLKLLYDHFFIKVLSGVLLTLLLASGAASAQQDQPKPTVSDEQQQRLGLMKSKGVDGSLTILPVKLFSEPYDRVSEVVGVLLEQRGLKNIELGKPHSAFRPLQACRPWLIRSENS
jgi:hypothetical protein